MVISCIGYIGKQNQPLAIRVYQGEDEVAMQFALYAAQDAVEQRLAAKSSDPFLGYIGPALCLPTDYKLYAYVSSSNVKVIAALEDRHYDEADVNEFLCQLYRLYADVICNPFLLDTIESPLFDLRLRHLVNHWSMHLVKPE